MMDATTGRLHDKLVRKGMPTAEVEAELQRLEAGRGMRGDAAGLTRESGLWSLRDLGSAKEV